MMQPPKFAVREEASLFGALISAPNNTLPPELQFSRAPFPGADSFTVPHGTSKFKQ